MTNELTGGLTNFVKNNELTMFKLMVNELMRLTHQIGEEPTAGWTLFVD